MNVVIEASLPNVRPEDFDLLWLGEPHVVVAASTLPELLVALGIYATRSEARRAGRDGPVPTGLTLLRASKRVPLLAIWNPTYRNLTAEAEAWCAEMDARHPLPAARQAAR